ncbi:MAG: 5-oxoprolinase subunit PxpB [Desulfotalea sp.]
MQKTKPCHHISYVAENSLLIKYDEKFSTDLSVYIAKCAMAVDEYFGEAILNTIPSYDALLITFKPHKTGDFQKELEHLLKTVNSESQNRKEKTIEIPTYYNLEIAEFFNEVLTDMKLSKEEMIAKHTAITFFVYMIGFCPGFAYMGDLPEIMRLPRRKVPQLKIPVGSVAIADFQTAIYPLEMPGGWHIIGRTPLTIFDAKREQPSLFKQGDRVKFRAIDRNEFIDLGGKL